MFSDLGGWTARLFLFDNFCLDFVCEFKTDPRCGGLIFFNLSVDFVDAFLFFGATKESPPFKFWVGKVIRGK